MSGKTKRRIEWGTRPQAHIHLPFKRSNSCWPQLSERRRIVPPHRELVELKNERKDLKQTQTHRPERGTESERGTEPESERQRQTPSHGCACMIECWSRPLMIGPIPEPVSKSLHLVTVRCAARQHIPILFSVEKHSHLQGSLARGRR